MSKKLPLFEEYGDSEYLNKLKNLIDNTDRGVIYDKWDNYFDNIAKTGMDGKIKTLSRLTGYDEQSFKEDLGWYSDILSDFFGNNYGMLDDLDNPKEIYDILTSS